MSKQIYIESKNINCRVILSITAKGIYNPIPFYATKILTLFLFNNLNQLKTNTSANSGLLV